MKKLKNINFFFLKKINEFKNGYNLIKYINFNNKKTNKRIFKQIYFINFYNILIYNTNKNISLILNQYIHFYKISFDKYKKKINLINLLNYNIFFFKKIHYNDLLVNLLLDIKKLNSIYYFIWNKYYNIKNQIYFIIKKIIKKNNKYLYNILKLINNKINISYYFYYFYYFQKIINYIFIKFSFFLINIKKYLFIIQYILFLFFFILIFWRYRSFIKKEKNKIYRNIFIDKIEKKIILQILSLKYNINIFINFIYFFYILKIKNIKFVEKENILLKYIDFNNKYLFIFENKMFFSFSKLSFYFQKNKMIKYQKNFKIVLLNYSKNILLIGFLNIEKPFIIKYLFNMCKKSNQNFLNIYFFNTNLIIEDIFSLNIKKDIDNINFTAKVIINLIQRDTVGIFFKINDFFIKLQLKLIKNFFPCILFISNKRLKQKRSDFYNLILNNSLLLYSNVELSKINILFYTNNINILDPNLISINKINTCIKITKKNYIKKKDHFFNLFINKSKKEVLFKNNYIFNFKYLKFQKLINFIDEFLIIKIIMNKKIYNINEKNLIKFLIYRKEYILNLKSNVFIKYFLKLFHNNQVKFTSLNFYFFYKYYFGLNIKFEKLLLFIYILFFIFNLIIYKAEIYYNEKKNKILFLEKEINFIYNLLKTKFNFQKINIKFIKNKTIIPKNWYFNTYICKNENFYYDLLFSEKQLKINYIYAKKKIKINNESYFSNILIECYLNLIIKFKKLSKI